MDNRLFLLDKNYLLKQVQADLKLEMQVKMVEKIKEGYFLLFNPLRLTDEKTIQIEAFQPIHFTFFDELYDVLCGIYRFQIGDNQLELLFDGRSHYEKYIDDWKSVLAEYINQLIQRKNFVLAGLELSVFHSPENRIELAQNRMKVCVYDHFGLKVYKYKGIQKYTRKQA